MIPGVSKAKRKAPPPPPPPAPEETAKERKARLRAEAKAEEEGAIERAAAVLAEARARHDRKINEETFFEMLLLIAEGMTLRQICRMPGMPSRTLFHMYVNCEDDEEAARRSERLARAREIGLDEIADEVLDIVDDSSNDWIEREKDGEIVRELDREHIQRSKLRAETRLKLLAVWDSARYGARVAHSDADGKPLRGSGMSAGDLAIGLAKLVEAARNNDLALGEGIVIDQPDRGE